MCAFDTTHIVPGVFRIVDTCNVYGTYAGGAIDLIDFGDTVVPLHARGVEAIRNVYLTHHHRDQLQGLRASCDGPLRPERIWVPEAERHLVSSGLEAHLQAREVYNNYNTREDRFSSLDEITGTEILRDYAAIPFGAGRLKVLPTPGHTTGSVTLIGDQDGVRVAFVGDLLSGDGTIHSLAATEWYYGGSEGIVATVASLLMLKELALDVLLPSHGEPISNPRRAIERAVERLLRLLRLRDDPPALWTQRPTTQPTLRHGKVHQVSIGEGHKNPSSPQFIREFVESPYERVTDHLLVNRTASGNTHVLVSETGNAMFFDYGYDMFVWPDPAGFDRAKVRTWLYTLDALKRQFGVRKIEVAMPTHYHDDHVASLGILQREEGTEIWIPETVAPPLLDPSGFDLPCLWFDPIVPDRVVPVGSIVRWHEYDIEVFAFPGHTIYQAAYGFEVDGLRVLNVGDQYRPDSNGDLLSPAYIYKNGFTRSDYAASAELISAYRPDLILNGHWAPFYPAPSYFTAVLAQGRGLRDLHDELLGPHHPESAVPFFVRVSPFSQVVRPGVQIPVQVAITNPYPERVRVTFSLTGGGDSWWAPVSACVYVEPGETAATELLVPPAPTSRAGCRLRFAVDVTVNSSQRIGQVADGVLIVASAEAEAASHARTVQVGT